MSMPLRMGFDRGRPYGDSVHRPFGGGGPDIRPPEGRLRFRGAERFPWERDQGDDWERRGWEREERLRPKDEFDALERSAVEQEWGGLRERDIHEQRLPERERGEWNNSDRGDRDRGDRSRDRDRDRDRDRERGRSDRERDRGDRDWDRDRRDRDRGNRSNERGPDIKNSGRPDRERRASRWGGVEPEPPMITMGNEGTLEDGEINDVPEDEQPIVENEGPRVSPTPKVTALMSVDVGPPKSADVLESNVLYAGEPGEIIETPEDSETSKNAASENTSPVKTVHSTSSTNEPNDVSFTKDDPSLNSTDNSHCSNKNADVMSTSRVITESEETHQGNNDSTDNMPNNGPSTFGVTPVALSNTPPDSIAQHVSPPRVIHDFVPDDSPVQKSLADVDNFADQDFADDINISDAQFPSQSDNVVTVTKEVKPVEEVTSTEPATNEPTTNGTTDDVESTSA